MTWRATLGYAVLLAAILTAMFGFDHNIALAFGAMKDSDPVLIRCFQAVTTLGKSHWYLWPLGVFCLLTSCVLWRKPALRPVWLPRLQIAAFLFVNIALSGLAVDLLKIIIGRPRPVLLLEDGIFNQFSPFSTTSRWWSFPSGHSATGLSLALAAGAVWSRWRWPLLALAGAIAASRVVVTAHYLSDTLAGFGMAALVFGILAHLFRRRGWKPAAQGRQQDIAERC